MSALNSTIPGNPEHSDAGDLATARLVITALTREQDLLIEAHSASLVSLLVTLTDLDVPSPVLPPHPISPGVVPPPALACTKIYTTQDPSFLPEFWPQVTIHKEIYTLLAQGFCPLLTLFTNHALRQISNQASTYMKKMTVAGGSSAQLIDPDSFGLEVDLSLHLWKEAWENHLVFHFFWKLFVMNLSSNIGLLISFSC